VAKPQFQTMNKATTKPITNCKRYPDNRFKDYKDNILHLPSFVVDIFTNCTKNRTT